MLCTHRLRFCTALTCSGRLVIVPRSQQPKRDEFTRFTFAPTLSASFSQRSQSLHTRRCVHMQAVPDGIHGGHIRRIIQSHRVLIEFSPHTGPLLSATMWPFWTEQARCISCFPSNPTCPSLVTQFEHVLAVSERPRPRLKWMRRQRPVWPMSCKIFSRRLPTKWVSF